MQMFCFDGLLKTETGIGVKHNRTFLNQISVSLIILFLKTYFMIETTTTSIVLPRVTVYVVISCSPQWFAIVFQRV
jgi:hypothetical protein